MPKYIIFLHEESRSAYFNFIGRSGRDYRFLYSETHRAMIFNGEPISGEEFDAVAEDIFSADMEQNFCRPVPRRIVTAEDALAAPEEPSPALPPSPPEQPEPTSPVPAPEPQKLPKVKAQKPAPENDATEQTPPPQPDDAPIQV